MKKFFFFLVSLVFLAVPSSARAMIDPVGISCTELGYKVVVSPNSVTGQRENLCQFPDGSSCSLVKFNNGSCGKQFKPDSYCVKEGNQIFTGKCCAGLQPVDHFKGQKIPDSLVTCEAAGYTPSPFPSSPVAPYQKTISGSFRPTLANFLEVAFVGGVVVGSIGVLIIKKLIK